MSNSSLEIERFPGVRLQHETERDNLHPTLTEITEIMEGDSMENEVASMIHGRIIRKAKRTLSEGSMKPREESHVVGNLVVNGNKPPLSKNSKKSRNAKGRGIPKKGGGGGKGIWGRPGSEVDVPAVTDDCHDPNYDSDSQDGYIVQKVEPELSLEELERKLDPIIKEYFNHGDAAEVVTMLGSLNLRSQRHMILGHAIAMAMESHDPQRELTSKLICNLYEQVVDRDEVACGFDELLDTLGDLQLDTPDAPNLLGQFIARAVADDCLSPKYLDQYKGKVECPLKQVALDKADVLLSMQHGLVRLDNIWGVGGGDKPVQSLSRCIKLLLKEYLSSGDLKEASLCLKEIDVPHFHHEVVYQAITMGIELSTDRSLEQMTTLLYHLYSSNQVPMVQMQKGVQRVLDALPELSIDVPAAGILLEKMGNIMHEKGCIDDWLFDQLPARGRKRFVSEGDGGKIKEELPVSR